MANKELFKSSMVTKNKAGGDAYNMNPKQALAQLAVTGCLSNTFYSSGQDQLDEVIKLANQVDHKFLAKVAIYSRKHGFMKDMPALLTAILSQKEKNLKTKYLPVVFYEVCDNAKMVRNFVQIIRSGKVGRKSLGTQPKRLVSNWFNIKSDEVIFKSSIGKKPSIADVIKIAHPKPNTDSKNALFGYLIGREYNYDNLPKIVKDFENFKKDSTSELPNLSFEMLSSLSLSKEQWVEVAKKCTWTQARMNLNTFNRHGVFENKEIVKLLADKISNPKLIQKAKVFPYQIMTAYYNAKDLPNELRKALHNAMEEACKNIPLIDGKVFIFPDVSGSMGSPVTGRFDYSSSNTARCVDVAALMSSALARKNNQAIVIPFDVRPHKLDNSFYEGTIFENSDKLASFCGGGTNCASTLAVLNKEKAEGDVIILISDNESWAVNDSAFFYKKRKSTELMKQWNIFKERNPKAKMICIDIQPETTVQAINRKDILNVGGFSDRVFDIISIFLNSDDDSNHFVKIIEDNIDL
jgi:60 kDa SS-A/Ro ribonucleoprotein